MNGETQKEKNGMTIKRSEGLYTGYMGYMCGNGYEGSTDELDNVVKREAELLAEAFNRDIEIRFNSNRESGGAWLVNSLKGFDGNCQVGLSAGLKYKTPEGMSREDFLIKSTFQFIRSQPKELYISTKVDEDALKDPNLANSGNPDSRYCSLEHKTNDDALAWLVANVDTDKLYK